MPIGGSFRGRDDDLHIPIGETILDQLQRFNNQKSAALDKAHQRIKELEEENRLLKKSIDFNNRINTGKRGEEIMSDLVRRNTM